MNSFTSFIDSNKDDGFNNKMYPSFCWYELLKLSLRFAPTRFVSNFCVAIYYLILLIIVLPSFHCMRRLGCRRWSAWRGCLQSQWVRNRGGIRSPARYCYCERPDIRKSRSCAAESILEFCLSIGISTITNTETAATSRNCFSVSTPECAPRA